MILKLFNDVSFFAPTYKKFLESHCLPTITGYCRNIQQPKDLPKIRLTLYTRVCFVDVHLCKLHKSHVQLQRDQPVTSSPPRRWCVLYLFESCSSGRRRKKRGCVWREKCGVTGGIVGGCRETNHRVVKRRGKMNDRLGKRRMAKAQILSYCGQEFITHPPANPKM